MYDKGGGHHVPPSGPLRVKEPRIFLTGDFSQTFRVVKNSNLQYLRIEAKNEKSKTNLLSRTFKV